MAFYKVISLNFMFVYGLKMRIPGVSDGLKSKISKGLRTLTPPNPQAVNTTRFAGSITPLRDAQRPRNNIMAPGPAQLKTASGLYSDKLFRPFRNNDSNLS